MAVLWQSGPTEVTDEALVAAVDAMHFAGEPPLGDSAIALLGGISKAILASPKGRAQPQYVALGFWLRSASMQRLVDRLGARMRMDDRLIVPRGVALHLPPTNVDTIFVYSWAVSVLAGNCNIVRLPSTVDAGTDWLVKLIAAAVTDAGQSHRQIFAQWEQSDLVGTQVAARVDLRMIWGGDAKVDAVSRTPIRPDGLSVGFPDRKSLALINTAAYRGATDAERDALAAHFFNDIFWFDQMGCGSPRLLVWVGDDEPAGHDLLNRVAAVAAAKQHQTETGTAIAKFAIVNDLLASALAQRATTYTNALHAVAVDDLSVPLGLGQGGGFLAEARVENISDIAPAIGRKIQTITHYGFASDELWTFGRALSGRGGYRIVPIGQALQFDVLWDGIDLMQAMTRAVAIVGSP